MKEVFMLKLKLIPAVVVLLAAPFTAAQPNASPSGAATRVLRGTVSYRQRVALPPDAVVRIMIKDVSHADAEGPPFAEQEITTNGHQVPIKFEVKYDPAAIDPTHPYQIRAKITYSGRLLFTTTSSYPVLTQGAPTDHVAMDLEEVSAQLDQLPSGSASHLHKPLAGTEWILAELNGKVPGSEVPQASIRLIEDTHRVEGSGGCNRLMGSYALDGPVLHFKEVATTMMACEGEAMVQERAFLKALEATQSYRIRNTTLLLMGKDGKVLARLEAQSASVQPERQ